MLAAERVTSLILVGTSGWSHDEWVGPFYPVSLRDAPHAWLAHYARRFRTVEITSTFDAFPDEDLVAAWSAQGVALADAGVPFEFSVHLPRAATHDALARGDVQRAWELAARFERHVLEPLADEGLLGAVLVRLPSEVAPSAAAARDVREVLSALAGRSVALDLAHPAWAPGGEPSPAALDLLTNGDVCLARTDAPGAPPVAAVPPSRHAFVRLLGRGPGDAPHDHLYGAAGLGAWAERARGEAAEGRTVRAYFANVPRAKAPSDAITLLHLLGEATDVAALRVTEQSTLPL